MPFAVVYRSAILVDNPLNLSMASVVELACPSVRSSPTAHVGVVFVAGSTTSSPVHVIGTVVPSDSVASRLSKSIDTSVGASAPSTPSEPSWPSSP